MNTEALTSLAIMCLGVSNILQAFQIRELKRQLALTVWIIRPNNEPDDERSEE